MRLAPGRQRRAEAKSVRLAKTDVEASGRIALTDSLAVCQIVAMPRRHQYERWYYYRWFKGAMDFMYKCGAWACLLLGFLGGIWLESVWLGLFFFLAAIAYHSQFIGRQQRDLAQFWGEGDDQSFVRALKSGCMQYGVFIAILVIFFYGALSRCRGPAPTAPSSSSPPHSAASSVPSQSPPPTNAYSELSAAMSEVHGRFAKRLEGTLYTTSDAYVRSYELRGGRPAIRTWAQNGKIGYVLRSICETTLHEHGFERPIFETEYSR